MRLMIVPLRKGFGGQISYYQCKNNRLPGGRREQPTRAIWNHTSFKREEECLQQRLIFRSLAAGACVRCSGKRCHCGEIHSTIPHEASSAADAAPAPRIDRCDEQQTVMILLFIEPIVMFDITGKPSSSPISITLSGRLVRGRSQGSSNAALSLVFQLLLQGRLYGRSQDGLARRRLRRLLFYHWTPCIRLMSSM
jgi:hypothetical protein